MKICIHCKQPKSFDQFYKHPKMADGHLGRCKDCHKAEIHRNYLSRLKDPEWREKELERQREKSRSQRFEGKKSSADAMRRGGQKWDQANKFKKHAHSAVSHAIKMKTLIKMPCEICGNVNAQAHHDDYSKPLDVRWLCVKHHNQHHVEMRKLERFTQDQISILA